MKGSPLLLVLTSLLVPLPVGASNSNPRECLGPEVGQPIRPRPPGSASFWRDTLPFWERSGFGNNFRARGSILAKLMQVETGLSTTLISEFLEMNRLDAEITLNQENGFTEGGNWGNPSIEKCRKVLALRRQRDQAIGRFEKLVRGSESVVRRWYEDTVDAVVMSMWLERAEVGVVRSGSTVFSVGDLSELEASVRETPETLKILESPRRQQLAPEARLIELRILLAKVWLLSLEGAHRGISLDDPQVGEIGPSLLADIKRLAAIRSASPGVTGTP